MAVAGGWVSAKANRAPSSITLDIDDTVTRGARPNQQLSLFQRPLRRALLLPNPILRGVSGKPGGDPARGQDASGER